MHFIVLKKNTVISHFLAYWNESLPTAISTPPYPRRRLLLGLSESRNINAIVLKNEKDNTNEDTKSCTIHTSEE